MLEEDTLLLQERPSSAAHLLLGAATLVNAGFGDFFGRG